MNFPDYALTASGGAHVNTTKNPDGSWTASTTTPGVPPVHAVSEQLAISELLQRARVALNVGQK
jgi:hypothetical protein